MLWSNGRRLRKTWEPYQKNRKGSQSSGKIYENNLFTQIIYLHKKPTLIFQTRKTLYFLFGFAIKMSTEMETDQPPEYDTNNNDSKPTTPVPDLIEQEDFVMVPDIPGAEEAKAAGNVFYKNQEYRKALEQYQEAHKLYPTHHTYLGNIAATYLALQNYRDALLASQDACKLDSTYVKGYSRQIKCQIYLGQGAAARSVMNEAEKHLMGQI